MRSSRSIAWAVWKALFLREAVSRLSAGRAAWLWILLEPIVHLVFLNLLFGVILQAMISGVEGGLFITTGVLGYLITQHTAMRSKEAISSNSALFTYRQVLPVDTVLVRAALEAVLISMSGLFLLIGLGLLGYSVMPADVLQAFIALALLWFAGTGLGLMLSVAGVLLPELAKVTEMLFRPLYFLSGVMYPPSAIPAAYQDWLLINPLVHGIEAFRTAFFSQYHTISGVSIGYIAAFATATMCVGLALHVRFAQRITAQ